MTEDRWNNDSIDRKLMADELEVLICMFLTGKEVAFNTTCQMSVYSTSLSQFWQQRRAEHKQKWYYTFLKSCKHQSIIRYDRYQSIHYVQP
jgi:hypothetical protein